MCAVVLLLLYQRVLILCDDVCDVVIVLFYDCGVLVVCLLWCVVSVCVCYDSLRFWHYGMCCSAVRL